MTVILDTLLLQRRDWDENEIEKEAPSTFLNIVKLVSNPTYPSQKLRKTRDTHKKRQSIKNGRSTIGDEADNAVQIK